MEINPFLRENYLPQILEATPNSADLLAVAFFHARPEDDSPLVGADVLGLTEADLWTYSFKVARKNFWNKKTYELIAVSHYSLHSFESATFNTRDSSSNVGNATIVWKSGVTSRLFTGRTEDGASFMARMNDKLGEVLRKGTLEAPNLELLAGLKQKGMLSEDEWSRAKELFLGKPANKQDEAIQLIEDLHRLKTQGVLSEGEFNLKKWSVLSAT